MNEPSLGKHIFREQDFLINLTTQMRLPLNASISQLQEHLFLVGQEEASIRQRLFGRPHTNIKSVNITIIPTWECNLRCSHCFVLHKLKANHKSNIDISALSSFINSMLDTYTKLDSIGIAFIGGEPLLNHRLCSDVIANMPTHRAKFEYNITTNGTIVNESVIELLTKIRHITVSVDGPKILHNIQRKSLTGIDPFSTTYNNIKLLVARGFRDAITTQASLPNEHYNKETIREYIKMMLIAGVKFNNIKYGTIVPTKQKPSITPTFLRSLHNRTSPSPCCKYRFNSNFYIDDNNSVYCDYFEDSSRTNVGTLYDDITTIELNMRQMIEDNIPALQDQTCKQCPVVGACWGFCSNVHNQHKASELCDQQSIIQIITQAAADNKLNEYFIEGTSTLFRKYKQQAVSNQSVAQCGTGGSIPPTVGKLPSA